MVVQGARSAHPAHSHKGATGTGGPAHRAGGAARNRTSGEGEAAASQASDHHVHRHEQQRQHPELHVRRDKVHGFVEGSGVAGLPYPVVNEDHLERMIMSSSSLFERHANALHMLSAQSLGELQLALADPPVAQTAAKEGGTTPGTPPPASKFCEEEQAQRPDAKCLDNQEGWISKFLRRGHLLVQGILTSGRGGPVNWVVTIASIGVGPENDLLKAIYILYSADGEDDYPYLPHLEIFPIKWAQMSGSVE